MRQALEAGNGNPVRLVDEQTRRVYYVISAEQFEAVQALLQEGEFSPREMYSLISKTAAAAGWDDPAMDDYNHYDEHRHEG
jgi:hypothetical protein